MKPVYWLALAGSLAAGQAHAADTQVTMQLVNSDGSGETIGQVHISETAHGLLFEPDLKQLGAGFHGFHLHQHASCKPQMKDGSMTAAAVAGSTTKGRIGTPSSESAPPMPPLARPTSITAGIAAA